MIELYQPLFNQSIKDNASHLVDDLFNLIILKYGYQKVLTQSNTGLTTKA